MKHIAELQAFVAGNAPGDDTATLELSRAAVAELLAEVESLGKEKTIRGVAKGYMVGSATMPVWGSNVSLTGL